MTTVGLIVLIGALVLGYEASKLFGVKYSTGASASSLGTASGGVGVGSSAAGTSSPATSSASGVYTGGTTATDFQEPNVTLSENQLQSYIDQALRLANAPLSWAQQIRWIISKENGSLNTYLQNPVAVNGQHATGLLQLMPSTFHAYFPGGDITNPVQNLAAGIRHIQDAWGTPFNPNLIASENAGIGY